MRTPSGRRAPWLVLYLITLSSCADTCGERVAPQRVSQSWSPPKTPGRPEGPPPPGIPVDAEQLRKAAPQAIGDFVLDGEPELRAVRLQNGGTVSGARLNYAHGGITAGLELSDTLHSPATRQLIERAKRLSKITERHVLKTATIQNRPSVIQWNAGSKTAVASLVVADRFMVSLRVRPADNAEVARELAEKLPLDGLVALAEQRASDHADSKGDAAAAPSPEAIATPAAKEHAEPTAKENAAPAPKERPAPAAQKGTE